MVRVLVTGKNQIDAGQFMTSKRCPRHADMRPVCGCVLLRQVLREIKVDGEQTVARLDQEAALAEPPDDE